MRKIKVIYGVEYEWTTKGNITYWFPIKKYNSSTELFIEEYNRVCVSKAENKKQYKGERK